MVESQPSSQLPIETLALDPEMIEVLSMLYRKLCVQQPDSNVELLEFFIIEGGRKAETTLIN